MFVPEGGTRDNLDFCLGSGSLLASMSVAPAQISVSSQIRRARMLTSVDFDSFSGRHSSLPTVSRTSYVPSTGILEGFHTETCSAIRPPSTKERQANRTPGRRAPRWTSVNATKRVASAAEGDRSARSLPGDGTVGLAPGDGPRGRSQANSGTGFATERRNNAGSTLLGRLWPARRPRRKQNNPDFSPPHFFSPTNNKN